jgi:hypothetical protein
MLSLLVFNKVNRLKIQLVKLVFSTPLTFSLVHLPPPPPCVNKYMGMYLCIQCVTGVGGSCCVESTYKSYTLYLTRFRTYKITLPPQTKTLEGWGSHTDKHLPPSFFTGQFLRKARHLGLESIIYLVHVWNTHAWAELFLARFFLTLTCWRIY